MSNPSYITHSGRIAGENGSWFETISCRYRVQDTQNGTNSTDSMPEYSYLFTVEEGKIATVNANLEVDDWGLLTILTEANSQVTSSLKPLAILKINMLPKGDPWDTFDSKGVPGPRGGHALQSKSASVQLPPGTYILKVKHRNVTYQGGYANQAGQNISVCNFNVHIEARTAPIRIPERIDVVYDSCEPNASVLDLRTYVAGAAKYDEQGGSYCASGYIFRGTATVTFTNNETRTFAVQSGGWMNKDSPFFKANNRPESNTPGEYTPTNYPDTLIPESIGDIRISTTRAGRTVDGFKMPDSYFTDTGRRSMFLHKQERNGSEGCISTPDPEWEVFCAEMTKCEESTIPIRITYSGISPNPTRKLPES